MDIINKIINQLSGKDRDSIYLREIALLMEQMDELKAKLEVKENLIKTTKMSLKGEINEFKRRCISGNKYAENTCLAIMGRSTWQYK